MPTRSSRRCRLAGKNLTRQDLVNAVNNDGAQAGPDRASSRSATPRTVHGGYGGAEMGQVRNGKIVLFGGPLVTEPTAGTPDHAVHGNAAGAAGERNPDQLARGASTLGSLEPGVLDRPQRPRRRAGGD